MELKVTTKKEKTVPFGEGAVGGDGDLVLLAGDGDGVAKSTGLAADLDSLLEELFEGGDVHDLILHRLRAVDDEGRSLLLALGPRRRRRPTTHFSPSFLRFHRFSVR